MRLLIACLLLWMILPYQVIAETSPAIQPSYFHQVTIEPRLSYEQYNMPADIKPLGVLGEKILVDFTNNFYGGLGLYSAVNGESGGYFALAFEGGIQLPLWHQLFIDGGGRLGGGGGRHTPVGGGLYIEPYMGLKYDFGLFKTGAYYSYINFVDGQIKSQQLGVELTLPLTFNYVTPYEMNPCRALADLLLPQPVIGHTQNYVALLGRTYLPNQDSTLTNGEPMSAHFEFLGIEAAHFFTDHVFGFFNFAGAFHGQQNGYADALLGLGYRVPFGHRPVDGIFKLGVGSGGGASVNTGGGLIVEPTAGLEYHFNPCFSMEANIGYVIAPNGHFTGKEVSVLAKYYIPNAVLGANNGDDELSNLQAIKLIPWRIRLLNQTYLNPRAVSGVINPTMQLLGFDLDYFVLPGIYLTGQADFAYVGLYTGGYFSGLLGAGIVSPPVIDPHWHLFAELLGGTAGGAGLDIGQGALMAPVAGISYQVNPAFSVDVAVSRLMAVQGQFSSTVINAGIGYRFSSIA